MAVETRSGHNAKVSSESGITPDEAQVSVRSATPAEPSPEITVRPPTPTGDVLDIGPVRDSSVVRHLAGWSDNAAGRLAWTGASCAPLPCPSIPAYTVCASDAFTPTSLSSDVDQVTSELPTGLPLLSVLPSATKSCVWKPSGSGVVRG